jgi:hypothetical protein
LKLITYGYEPPVTDGSKPNKQIYQKCLATTPTSHNAFNIINPYTYFSVNVVMLDLNFAQEGDFWDIYL